MSHSERIQEAAKEIQDIIRYAYTPTWEAIAAIISKHIPEQNEWVKVTPETMPKDGAEVLVRRFITKTTRTALVEDGHFCNPTERPIRRMVDVSHWMPNPIPPEDEL